MVKAIGILRNLEWLPMFKRYAKFCLVGGSGVIVDMAVIWLLASPSVLGWNLTVSKVVAAEAALFNNFAWNEVWTFREFAAAQVGWHKRLARFLKFNLVCTAGIGLSVILLNAQVYGLGWNAYLANFISIVLVSGWNFLLNLRFGWKNTGGQKATTGPATAERLLR